MSARIRVAHVINSMEVGGAQRQLANLFRAVDRERFALHLICLNDLGSYGEALRNEGFPAVALDKKPGFDARMLLGLRRQLREWQIQIVHSSVFTSNLWGRLAALGAGVPRRITHEQSTVTLDRATRRWLERLLSPWTWRSLCVSDDLRRRFVDELGIPPRRLELLYNAIDVEAVARSAGQPAPELPGERGFRVGAVGRLEYRKDHPTLLRAARLVLEREPRARFFLAGEGPERARLEAEAARLGLADRFVFLGERHDVPRLLHAFDVYVLSSITEGLSLSILEAMAARRPVVATDVGGNAELLEGGAVGRLVAAGDSEEMGRAIVALLADPALREEIGNKALVRARENFDIHPVARRLEAIYEQAIRE